MILDKHKIYFLQTSYNVSFILPISKVGKYTSMVNCIDLSILENLPKYDTLKEYMVKTEVDSNFSSKKEIFWDFPKDAIYGKYHIEDKFIEESVCIPIDYVRIHYPELLLFNRYPNGIRVERMYFYKRDYNLSQLL